MVIDAMSLLFMGSGLDCHPSGVQREVAVGQEEGGARGAAAAAAAAVGGGVRAAGKGGGAAGGRAVSGSGRVLILPAFFWRYNLGLQYGDTVTEHGEGQAWVDLIARMDEFIEQSLLQVWKQGWREGWTRKERRLRQG